MFRRLIALLLCLFALPALAQTTPRPPSPLVRVEMKTTEGNIVLQFDKTKAPVTVANFLHYVDQKRLDGVTFYRTVKVEENFGFVQFGVRNDPKRVLPPIKHEPTSETGLKHLNGTVSIARLKPGSASGDFTIMMGDQPSMDADPSKPGDNLGYAAFGRVVEGMDVIVKIFDAPVSPDKTVQGAFKGEIPMAPVKILTARRVATSAAK